MNNSGLSQANKIRARFDSIKCHYSAIFSPKKGPQSRKAAKRKNSGCQDGREAEKGVRQVVSRVCSGGSPMPTLLSKVPAKEASSGIHGWVTALGIPWGSRGPTRMVPLFMILHQRSFRVPTCFLQITRKAFFGSLQVTKNNQTSDRFE